MEKKDIYVVQLAWSYDVNSGIDLALFDSREKAIAKFKEIIEQEKTMDHYWAKEAFDKNGNLIKDKYELDTNLDDPNALEYYWEIKCLDYPYLCDSLQLYIKGVD